MYVKVGVVFGVISLILGLLLRLAGKNENNGFTYTDLHAYNELSHELKQKLSWCYVSGNMSQYERFKDLYDPRLTPALWLQEVNSRLKDGDSLEEIQLPFSWESLLPLSSSEDSCEMFIQKHSILIPDGRSLDEYCINDEFGRLKVLHSMQTRMPEEARAVYGLNYLKHTSWVPDSIYFITSAGLQGFHTYLASHQLVDSPEEKGINITQESIIFESLTSQNSTLQPHQFPVEDGHKLSNAEFITDEMYQAAPEVESKFFFEAILSSGAGEHFDWRFFRKFTYSDYERQAVLHRIARAWLRFVNAEGLKSWIAHGSLLGWFWNGMSMPWDSDLDVQMTMESFMVLQNKYNNTLVIDLNDGASGSYLIEVNPIAKVRQTSNRTNAIDARFVDTQTGLYIDITTLTVTEHARRIDVSDYHMQKEFNQLLDPEYVRKKESTTISIEDLNHELSDKRDNLVDNGQLVNCKDNHYYNVEELSLKHTLFEGVKALVPTAYEAILKREYNKALYNRIYNKYHFRSALWVWIPSKVCKNDPIGLQCTDPETKHTREATKDITEAHKLNLYYRLQEFREHEPAYVDPWMLERGRAIMQ